MACRHVGCRKPVWHFGHNGINSVPSRGESGQIDPVGIHIVKGDHIFDEPVVERVGFRVKMAVPGIAYSSGIHMDAVLDAVLIISCHMRPLAVVQIRCVTLTAAVKGDEKRITVFVRLQDSIVFRRGIILFSWNSFI